MTDVASSNSLPEGRTRDAQFGSRIAAILLAIVPAFILSLPQARVIWSTGTFVDTDDAMRMTQVRDWLAGQGWYDLTEHRMDPPFGVFMHWSRLVDVPLAALIKLFELFFAPHTAELLTRIAFPLLLQIGLIASVVWTAQRLEGHRALLPAAFLTVLSGMTFNQFQPGRIDHDDVQIVLLVLTLGACLAALEPKNWLFAALAGALTALSLGVGLENLPFLAVLMSSLPIAWALAGDRMKPALLALAAALSVSLPAVYLATVGPARWTLVVCDAFSPFHLVGFELGALACLALAAASNRLRTVRSRLVCTALAGGSVVLIAGLLFPACLGDPYAHVDPLVRTLWLDKVTEAQPLLGLVARNPSFGPMLILPPLFGIAFIVEGLIRSQGIARGAWAIVLASALTGVALSFWEIRASDQLSPIALLGGVRASTLVWRATERARWRATASLALLAILPFGVIPYAMLWPPRPNSVEARYLRDGRRCRAPGQYRGLASLPPGLVLAPIDAGAHILALTRDSVLAAPFHRDNRGNRMVLQMFRADPIAAGKMAKAAGVRYVAVCKGFDPNIVKGSLADELQKRAPPAWLKPAPVPLTRMNVYVVR